jgi:hypothetical protein
MAALAWLSRLSAGNSYPCWTFQKSDKANPLLAKVGVESTNRQNYQPECDERKIYWAVTTLSTIYDSPFIGYPHGFVTFRRRLLFHSLFKAQTVL